MIKHASKAVEYLIARTEIFQDVATVLSLEFPVLFLVRLVLTAVAGITGGILLVACWWRFGSVLLCMLIIGLVLGFLFSSMVFFTPLGMY